MALSKEYIGQIKLGCDTDTDDVTGKVIFSSIVPELNLDQLNNICKDFIGEIPQVPPMFSAKKVGGQRLYKIARRGISIDRAPKIVTIYNIEIIDFQLPLITLKVTCGKGTYIRALARDIGKKIGCGAHLYSLCRTKIGEYSIENSLTIDQFQALVESQSDNKIF
jgi:tRNA pseudouridine55 synthase